MPVIVLVTELPRPAGADSVGGAQDGAEVAGVLDLVQVDGLAVGQDREGLLECGDDGNRARVANVVVLEPKHPNCKEIKSMMEPVDLHV